MAISKYSYFHRLIRIIKNLYKLSFAANVCSSIISFLYQLQCRSLILYIPARLIIYEGKRCMKTIIKKNRTRNEVIIKESAVLSNRATINC